MTESSAVPNTLLAEIERNLLPAVSSLAIQVVDHQESDSFDNAVVVLQAGELRIRLVRERSYLFVDFGSTAEPNTWFDSAVVLDHLGLSEDAGFHDRRVQHVLAGLASLLKSFGTELFSLFVSSNFNVTKSGLSELQKSRAARRLGY
ncbi:MAG: hypothetical protein HY700_14795 [Gemmatimonadetes bacterium]|nr:hypothetical protein [Gemmatimonadota bacterium]